MLKKFFLAVFCFALSVSLFASYDDALSLFSEGKYQESLKVVAAELDAAQDMNPSSPNYNLRFLAAHNHWKLKNYEGAFSHFSRCRQIKPQAVEPLIDMALVYLQQNKWKEALALGQKIAEMDKTRVEAFYILGKARYGYQNYWGAKEYLEKATSLDFQYYPAWNELGKALLMLKKYSEAEIALSTAYALCPKSEEVMSNLAVAYYRNNKKDKAIDIIKEAQNLASKNEAIAKNAKIILGSK